MASSTESIYSGTVNELPTNQPLPRKENKYNKLKVYEGDDVPESLFSDEESSSKRGSSPQLSCEIELDSSSKSSSQLSGSNESSDISFTPSVTIAHLAPNSQLIDQISYTSEPAENKPKLQESLLRTVEEHFPPHLQFTSILFQV